jgi:signal transduction histidine kinase
VSKLTDKLLELARFARRPLQRQTVDLSKIAEQIMEDLCAQYPDRDVELTVTSDLLAIADPVQMQVVLENLLNNAWKFTEDRHPARISFTASVDNDVRVFCVSDNGVGFSMACADKLFRPFYRLHADQRFTGSGVGLANVERAILRHGGRVWAESEPDQGARFFFTLNDSAATKQPDQPDTKPPSVTNLTNTPAPD